MLLSGPCFYDELLDYRLDWPQKLIKMLGQEGIDPAYDCISEGETVETISNMLNPSGKITIVRSLEGGAWTLGKELPVQPSYGAVGEGLGNGVQYQGMNLPSNAEAKQFTAEFYDWLSATSPSLSPNKILIMPRGLKRIFSDEFRLLGSGSTNDRMADNPAPLMHPISAEKLVYLIDGPENVGNVAQITT